MILAWLEERQASSSISQACAPPTERARPRNLRRMARSPDIDIHLHTGSGSLTPPASVAGGRPGTAQIEMTRS